MPSKLTTTVNKIALLPNPTNSDLINEFYQYMKSNGASERHQNNNLKAIIAFANFLGTDTTFFDVQLKGQIMSFLDTKIKNVEEDPDKKWITTWNDYLHRIKHFFRWLYNQKDVEASIKYSTTKCIINKLLFSMTKPIYHTNNQDFKHSKKM